MQVVRELVGLDADQRRLDEVDRAQPLLQLDAGKGLGKRLAIRRVVVLPERARATDLVLPEPGLRLVQSERRGAAGEGPLDLLADDPLLVQPVAGLVDRGHERAARVARRDTRRETDVVRTGARCERMRRAILPPGLHVEAEVADHALGERELRLGRELPCEERHVGTRPICDLGDERNELVAQRVQQRLEPSEAHVGLERVEQRVVPVSVMPERIGLLLLERDDPLERRTERGEVASRARALPDLEALGLCHRELAHEVGRHLHRAVAVASRLAEARPLSLVERVACRLRLLDRLSERGVDHTLVQQRCQGRRLVGARLGALRGHHHLLVPAHQAGDAAEVDQLVHPTLEGGPRGRRHQ